MKIIKTLLGKVLVCTVVLHLAIAAGGTILLAGCGKDNPSGPVKPSEPTEGQDGDGGYLFAHMTHSKYGSLFYSISRDGLTWKTLNGGNVILDSYFGHPDICEGPDVFGNADRRWYMIGVVRGSSKESLVLWHTTDLVVWKSKVLDGEKFVVDHLGVYNEIPFVGAPKMFYDEDSERFLITWHAGEYYKKMQASTDPEQRSALDRKNWETMKTCYVLTKDFVDFTKPKRLFADQNGGNLAPVYFTGADADISLIDVIIRKYDGKYYAIMKDERWDDKAPKTYKSVRIASSDNLLGPYTNPGPSVSPNWREAPIMVRTPEGKFRLYYENYGEHAYEMRESTAIQGAPWKDVTNMYPPKDGRHGCIVHVDEKTYLNIEKSYK